jgi:hypothetical protein
LKNNQKNQLQRAESAKAPVYPDDGGRRAFLIQLALAVIAACCGSDSAI